MKKWKVDRVEAVLPRGEAYGFNITNDWGKPLISFAYETKGAADEAAAKIRSAIEEAIDVHPYPEWGVGGPSEG